MVDIRGRRILRHAEPARHGYGIVETLSADDELRSTAIPELAALRVGDVLDGELPGS